MDSALKQNKGHRTEMLLTPSLPNFSMYFVLNPDIQNHIPYRNTNIQAVMDVHGIAGQRSSGQGTAGNTVSGTGEESKVELLTCQKGAALQT